MGKNRCLTYWSHSFYYIWAASRPNQMACAPSEDSDQPGHPPSLIRVFAVHMKKAEVLSYHESAQRSLWSDSGRMPRLIWAFAGRKGHFFFFSWVASFYFVSLASTILIYVISFYFLKLPEKARVFMYPRTCMLVSVYYVTLQTNSYTHLYLSRWSTSLTVLVGPRGAVRVVSLMVNGYADIYKDNRRKHLRTHTMSNRRSIITTGLKLFRISMLSIEPALSAVAVKPKITAFKTSNNGKCYYWYCILRWLTWQLYLTIHSVSSKYM